MMYQDVGIYEKNIWLIEKKRKSIRGQLRPLAVETVFLVPISSPAIDATSS